MKIICVDRITNKEIIYKLKEKRKIVEELGEKTSWNGRLNLQTWEVIKEYLERSQEGN